MSTPAQPRTVEPQYQHHVELRDRNGIALLGIEKNANWHQDPRRLAFVLSRYKFVAKMLSGAERVLEVGCGDAWPVRIVLQEVKSIHAVDIDPVFIDDAHSRMDVKWPFTCAVHDMLSGPVPGSFDAAYSLDVLEHIPAESERVFMDNLVASLIGNACAIIGMPSLESQAYASPLSKIGHINCKSGPAFKTLMKEYFDHVFMFSMNDEVVHTGYHPMAQYLFALCTSPKR